MKSQFKTLAELASITPGFSPKPNERRKAGRYLLLGGRNIKDGKLVTSDADAYVDEIDRESFRRAIAHNIGDSLRTTANNGDYRRIAALGRGDGQESPKVADLLQRRVGLCRSAAPGKAGFVRPLSGGMR